MPGMIAMSPCYGCGTMFQFNPNKVPSVSDENSNRQPICGNCVVEINKIRKDKGMDEVRVLPGAYEPEIIE